MKSSKKIINALVASGLVLLSTTASAAMYQFQFLANPDALDPVQDKSMDVLHTVTIDSSKFAQFNSTTLSKTENWLNGGINLTMSHQGKSVSLNSGINVASPTVKVTGAYYDEGFLALSGNSPGFFALEFAPNSPFIDGNNLPYDPFVYGFLFAYQDSSAYKDFSSLWNSGNTSILSKYEVSAVPESSSWAFAAIGLMTCLIAARQKKVKA